MNGARASALGVTLALLASVAAARADSQTNAAVAESLFREAKALLAKGQTGPACRKLEESQRLDPGGGTLLSLALCHEKEGKTATAWSEFQTSVTLARNANRGDRERVASAHAAALESRLSRLVITAPPDVAGLEIKVDDVAIGQAAWGSKLPIDPGAHKVTASAPGFLAWSSDVDVGAHADVRTVAVPPLEALPKAPASSDSAAPDRQASGGLVTRRNVGIAGVAVGVVGVAIGAVSGIRAFSENNASKQGCKNGVCNQAGFADYQSGKTAATVSDIGFGAGLAFAALGGYLLFTSRAPAKTADSGLASIRATASVSPRRAAVVLGGGF